MAYEKPWVSTLAWGVSHGQCLLTRAMDPLAQRYTSELLNILTTNENGFKENTTIRNLIRHSSSPKERCQLQIIAMHY
jgi:hypothetical protein